jgi:hypothetical protein
VLISDDFMPGGLAERLHRFLYGLPEIAWSTWYGDDPRFRFRHLRAEHPNWCECAVCVARGMIAGEASERIAPLLGVGGLTLGASNVTWFANGDFLAPHTDAPNGDFAFVWSLTKSWHPSYGGNLHLCESVHVPSFNRFVLFEIADNRTSHHVSPVSAPPGARRLAISGWYRRACATRS